MQVSIPDQAFVEGCATRVVLDHVMSKWAPLVLVALARVDDPGRPGRPGDGSAGAATLRWSELRRRTPGVSEKMLAQTLRTLVDDGLVLREARAVVPPHVDYSLTPLGRDLCERLVPMLAWLAEHADAMVTGEPAARA